MWISWKWWKLAQNAQRRWQKLIFAIKLNYHECCTPWPWPNFSRLNFSSGYFSSKVWKMHILLLPSDRKSSTDLVLSFQGHKFEMLNISEKVGASAKMRLMTFAEVDIRHQMAQFWGLYTVTLTFIFKVKHFLVMHLLYKQLQVISPGRFSSTRMAFTVELLLLWFVSHFPKFLAKVEYWKTQATILASEIIKIIFTKFLKPMWYNDFDICH